jgi:hypothetical protein
MAEDRGLGKEGGRKEKAMFKIFLKNFLDTFRMWGLFWVLVYGHSFIILHKKLGSANHGR